MVKKFFSPDALVDRNDNAETWNELKRNQTKETWFLIQIRLRMGFNKKEPNLL